MTGDRARAQAEQRVRRKQGFQAHAFAYLLANTAMIAGWATSGGRFWPMWPLLGWGSGLAAHGWSVYRRGAVPARRIERELARLR